MSAATKLAANRANAALSTGPADTSRTRFNGLAHGLTSKQTVIRGEDQQEYDAFHTSLHRDLDPCSPTQLVIAERIIAAAWRLKRFARVEAAFFNNRIDAFLEANPDSDPDSAMANLFTDPAESARMRFSSVTKPASNANTTQLYGNSEKKRPTAPSTPLKTPTKAS